LNVLRCAPELDPTRSILAIGSVNIRNLITHSLLQDKMLTIPTDIEKLLVDIGAVRLGDQRLQKKKNLAEESTSKIRQGKTTGDDEDSDWD
jgi:hypothetical protein